MGMRVAFIPLQIPQQDFANTIGNNNTESSAVDDLALCGSNAMRNHYLDAPTWPPPTNTTTTTTSPQKSIEICVIVRTYHGHVPALPTLLDSLVIDKHQQEGIDLSTRLFVMDTNPEQNVSKLEGIPYAKDFGRILDCMIANANRRAGRMDAAHKLVCPVPMLPNKYGYDATDWALTHILNSTTPGTCTHLMFTNGDNYYLPSLLPELAQQLKSKDIVAWDFLTHHPRQHNMMSVDFKMGLIDLGSFVVKTDWVRSLPIGFQNAAPPRAKLAMFAADFYFIKALEARIPQERVAFIHNARMAHN